MKKTRKKLKLEMVFSHYGSAFGQNANNNNNNTVKSNMIYLI